MRERKDIEKDGFATDEYRQLKLIVELLLDIRDLLTPTKE